ncbi:VIT1/CCC1 family predicted Fe2+/Mn2+ transporter [Actinoplanes lutulentus]|uniref:VIT1/CCC1 family predicted Fe2+/Mn2+ transporter n=1 Tax=Actinoplanes lutulentus TaxID=1287878 RepID=A0A327Z7M9_9ACTN|nr:VIT1/CCC1 transporter family protein [Actinoplanes lutulentus]MBB2942267.1 VIT1/CCC1 family predicted Fe2+/Mn2+ transporter [Actinoplanes lutulentus]RAK33036.1 VIT1/CCC1 family predicted Fe2+/Mn2+ transporter [Actinoplanes lutulentus]
MILPAEHHHADVSGGWLRAATFGAMDGLVTNIALIAGVGGARSGHHTLILTGVAGLVAGAISMAIGEYTSVRTQNEQVAAELDKERHELRVNPDGEADELVAAWTARGLPLALARQVADVLKDNPDQALRVHAQEELGVVPDELPSPWTAASSSFVCFAAGALIPLLPLLAGFEPLWPALLAGGIGLFVVGAVIARLTARPWWRGGLRQLLLGGAAAGATFVIGTMLGA